MYKFSFFVLTVFLLQSCAPDDKIQTVSIEDRFSIDIPGYLKSVDNLNEDASLQYQNIWKQVFILVIEETKEEISEAIVENELSDIFTNDFDGYSDLINTNYAYSIEDYTESNEIDTLLNGIPAKLKNLQGTIEGSEIYYGIGLYHIGNYYYQVVTWTLGSKKDEYHNVFNDMLHSVRIGGKKEK